MIIPVKHSHGQYDIVLERGVLKFAADYMNLSRKVFIVTDSGLPKEYAQTVAKQCLNAVIVTIEQGEASKNFDTYQYLLKEMVNNDITRTDCVVAVGGGVVGDLAGFTAATYMRGIDFYNIPTTVLSQVDSSIGGKTAIDFCGLKNIVGAFYPPKAVLIDADTLDTLPKRQISNGLAEAVKMSLTCDAELFEMFETGYENYDIEEIIYRSLLIKRKVVELDEYESGLRKVLNFGHTVAHAIESLYDMDTFYHGECVGIGMLYMCSSNVKNRLLKVLQNLNLPTVIDGDTQKLLYACRHDKKMTGNDITVVFVEEVGSFEMKKISFEQLENIIKKKAEL